MYSWRLPQDLSNIKNVIGINIEAFKDLYNEDILNNFHIKDYEDFIVQEQWDGKDLNIILIFAESLSPIDSARLWWNDNIPLFDNIQKSWTTFVNFITNWRTSIWSHIYTFLWIPFFSDVNTEPLPKFLNELWYETIYISTANLNFLDEKNLLYNFWFQRTIWEEEFKNNKKYTFNAAPDWDLYDKILETLQGQKWKYFISSNTISFHTPYNCPYGRTQKDCLKYTDEKLYDFYTSLVNIGFFDNGILIIVWDHRKREAIENGEYEIFWPSRKHKTVATVVWSWIKPWETNNDIVQNTDIYYSLKKLLWKNNITLDMFYNDIFSNNSNRNRWIIENIFVLPTENGYFIQNSKTTKENNKEIYYYYLSLKNHFKRQYMTHKSL